MQPAIDAVRKSLTRFTNEIIERDVSARYMIVMYGLFPEIILDWVDDGYLCRDALAQVRAAEANNFDGPAADADVSEYNGDPPKWLVHSNHDCVGCNTREASFEAIRMVLGGAQRNVFERHPLSKSANLEGPGQFRPNAQKFIILLTNEDSDCGYFEENKLVDTSLGSGSGGLGRQCPAGSSSGGFEDTRMNPPIPFPLQRTGGWQDLWLEELKITADAVVASGAMVNMFVREAEGSSARQYGPPSFAVQSSDFSGFDANRTLQLLSENVEFGAPRRR